ncbi:MAG: hypothetical protein JSW68_04515 [Burkholderiales bacterium]|nr:MAG: hypothetical protein JSW68_04515 [Burkholderiales bacterium]
MSEIAVSVGPVIAGLLGLEAEAPTLSVPLPDERPAKLRDVLEALESRARAPGALLEQRSGTLHRYIHARVNGKPVSELAHPVGAQDKLRLSMRMIESG